MDILPRFLCVRFAGAGSVLLVGRARGTSANVERTGVEVLDVLPLGAGLECAEAGGSLGSTDSAGLPSMMAPLVSRGVRIFAGFVE